MIDEIKIFQDDNIIILSKEDKRRKRENQIEIISNEEIQEKEIWNKLQLIFIDILKMKEEMEKEDEILMIGNLEQQIVKLDNEMIKKLKELRINWNWNQINKIIQKDENILSREEKNQELIKKFIHFIKLNCELQEEERIEKEIFDKIIINYNKILNENLQKRSPKIIELGIKLNNHEISEKEFELRKEELNPEFNENVENEVQIIIDEIEINKEDKEIILIKIEKLIEEEKGNWNATKELIRKLIIQKYSKIEINHQQIINSQEDKKVKIIFNKNLMN